MRSKLLIFFIAFPFSLASCKQRIFHSETAPRTVSRMQRFLSTPVDNFKLGFAEKNGITNYRVFRDIVNQDTSVEERRRYVVRIVFDKLTEAQYKLLMAHYGGQGFVPYDASRQFELTDFLPPKMQAFVDHWLVTTSGPDARIPSDWQSPYLPDEPVVSGVTMNCWTTAFEVLREWGKPWSSSSGKLAYFGPLHAEKMLTNNKSAIVLQQPLVRADWTTTRVQERNAGRLPGDLLHIRTKYSTIGPAHVALWIDDDLYFEKTNSSSNDPIRLAFYSDVVKPYLDQDDPELPMMMEFLRFKATALPEPESIAGRDPFDREGLSPLPEDVKKNTIFTLDLGMGGNLKEFSANRILSFPLERNPETGRASLRGAKEISHFLISDDLCQSVKDRFSDSSFSYKVKTGPQLFVFNGAGKEIARIAGKRGGSQGIVGEFRTSDKVLTVTRKDANSFIFVLNHPGISSNISLQCVRPDVF